MKINIRGDKLKITDAINTHTVGKLKKLEKYFETPDEVNVNVVFRIIGNNHVAEITIPGKNIILRTEERTQDLYNSINQAVDKIERQIRKNKERMNSKTNRKKLHGFIADIENYEKQTMNTITRRKEIETKPMSEEEAILQMNLLDHDFFIFVSDITNKAAVIYKRKDGDYGIIETI